jgi:hypothetical protein
MGRFSIGGGEPLQTATEKVRRRWQTFESLSAPDRQIPGVGCFHGKSRKRGPVKPRSMLSAPRDPKYRSSAGGLLHAVNNAYGSIVQLT